MEAHIHPTESPLQLNRYFLKKLHFTLQEGFDRGRRQVKGIEVPSLRIGVVSADQNPDNPLQWRFEVHLKLDESEAKNFPYTIEANVVGYFTVSKKYNKERADQMAKTNGPALLYSSARDLITAITGRSPYPALQIPSMMFIPLGENKPERKVLPTSKKRSTKSAKRETAKVTRKAAKK